MSRCLPYQPAAIQLQLPLQAAGQLVAMRHHDQDGLLLPLQFQQQFGDAMSRRAIEIAGRLVGQHQQRRRIRARAIATALPFAAG